VSASLTVPPHDAVLRRTLVPTQHLVHKLQSTHDKDNNQGFLSPLTVRFWVQGSGLRVLAFTAQGLAP
jgi:hypothetical protein